ncbi:hypothetical protein BN946_scf184998.g29 [Trametes cinnabarina]|uniref:Oxidoreductase AflY n=1 Tax=Pycnoporus cinnabarinus TaxID=5643 RepID=A0A060S2C3_PYCCI|nr:hypothetical protein BN946_scf184998.g29 [Trametes cinnabarina]
MNTPKPEELDSLFPLPSPYVSPQIPARLPGITHASSKALVDALKDNHVKWHAYFNDLGFHNHASHHLVAIYAMGAGAPLIEAAYQTHVEYMKPAFASPEPIDEKTFWLHLGKRDFYNSYLEFFRAQLLSKSISEVFDEYVFSPRANIGGAGVKGEPHMLLRFYGALVHPMIHAGCGLEFGLKGLVAEGLAQAATHADGGKKLVPDMLFLREKEPNSPSVSRLSALLPSLSLRRRYTGGERTASHGERKSGVHAFSILARISADPRFSAENVRLPAPEGVSPFDRVNDTVGEALAELAAEWAADLEGNVVTADKIREKIEELAWMNVIIYGIGGWGGRERSETKQFNADFFYMHLVTSSISLPTYAAYFSPETAGLLLHTYFAVCIAWYVARGRAPLPIREFYEATTVKPAPPSTGTPATPAENTLTPDDPAPNPWLPIVQTTITHPGEHVCKLQRALMHNATVYGARKAGHFAGTELEGAELLDGTLFIRVAGLSADRVGWMKEGQEHRGWDRTGFY